MKFSKISLFVASAVLLTACRSSTNSETPAAAPTPVALSTVLSTKDPLPLYVGIYGAFRLNSETHADTGSDALVGKSLLERDESGNFHLIRKPVNENLPVELIYLQRKAYLRVGAETSFRVVQNQPEFERWANRSFRELFLLFEQAEYPERTQLTAKDGVQCLSRRNGKLCVNLETGLPVEGWIRTEAKDRPKLEVRFSVTPGSAKPIQVELPK